jgi:hypothetical protein
MRRSIILLAVLIAVAWSSWSLAAAGAIQNKEGAAEVPGVAGAWVGTWGPYAPPQAGTPPGPTTPRPEARLDCKVVALPEGKWQTTFEGECGRPYKYTIKMLGRTAGSVVLFQGSADLGEKDGGVYDWIGRATEKEFVGFYTSASHTGHFRLTRPGP